MPALARRLLLASSLIGMALLTALALVVVPRLPAIRCLLAFQEATPDDLAVGTPAPADLRWLEDEVRYGAQRAWLLRQPDPSAPTLVFVHGVAPKGLRDGRIVQAVRAFGRAGFTVIAPELPTLVDPLDQSPVGAVVFRCLQRIAGGAYQGARRDRIGIVGISVGGALALRGAARFVAAGGRELRAALLIGAPDDLRRSARAWFAAADPAPVSDGSLAWRQANAAAFGRLYLIRAGLLPTYGDDAEVRRLDAWLGDGAPAAKTPSDLRRPELAALAHLVHAVPAVRAAARETILARAASRIEALSPALWDKDLPHLAGMAIFLLHGHGDPLVGIDEEARLADRLRTHTLVAVLASHMVAHTHVQSVGLAERLAHVVQMDDFFDMIAR